MCTRNSCWFMSAVVSAEALCLAAFGQAMEETHWIAGVCRPLLGSRRNAAQTMGSGAVYSPHARERAAIPVGTPQTRRTRWVDSASGHEGCRLRPSSTRGLACVPSKGKAVGWGACKGGPVAPLPPVRAVIAASYMQHTRRRVRTLHLSFEAWGREQREVGFLEKLIGDPRITRRTLTASRKFNG